MARHQWLMPVILVTQEAEIRRIEVRSQPGQRIIHETLSRKTHHKKKGLVDWLKVKGLPEFKPQYHKKKKHRM
jgi:hypothetical protein